MCGKAWKIISVRWGKNRWKKNDNEKLGVWGEVKRTKKKLCAKVVGTECTKSRIRAKTKRTQSKQTRGSADTAKEQ